jgi:hypothetical protein
MWFCLHDGGSHISPWSLLLAHSRSLCDKSHGLSVSRHRSHTSTRGAAHHQTELDALLDVLLPADLAHLLAIVTLAATAPWRHEGECFGVDAYRIDGRVGRHVGGCVVQPRRCAVHSSVQWGCRFVCAILRASGCGTIAEYTRASLCLGNSDSDDVGCDC